MVSYGLIGISKNRFLEGYGLIFKNKFTKKFNYGLVWSYSSFIYMIIFRNI